MQISGGESYPLKAANTVTNYQGGNDSNFINGPDEEELIGLQLSERKRMRGGPNNFEIMDTAGGLTKDIMQEQITGTSGVDLSKMDCSSSSKLDLATLAMQASQQP